MDKNVSVVDLDLEELKKKLGISIGDEKLFRKLVGADLDNFVRDEFLILKSETYLRYNISLTLEAFRGELRFRVDVYDNKAEISKKTILEPFGKESYLDVLTSFDGEILRLKRKKYEKHLKRD